MPQLPDGDLDALPRHGIPCPSCGDRNADRLDVTTMGDEGKKTLCMNCSKTFTTIVHDDVGHALGFAFSALNDLLGDYQPPIAPPQPKPVPIVSKKRPRDGDDLAVIEIRPRKITLPED